MIVTTQDLLEKYKNYADPLGKIHRDMKDGKLFSVIKGIYETDPNLYGEKLAQIIYGPSYLSFDFVLYLYSIIPEAMYNTFTCATFNKRKRKVYQNKFGTFYYRDVPNEVFPYGVEVVQEGGYTYHIATLEKAFCDKLYILPPVYSMKEFRQLLFENLRIDDEILNNFDKEFIYQIAPMYHKRNLDFLVKYFKEL